MRTLFDDIPAQRHSETSVAAAESIRPTAAKLRERVYDAIKSSEDGMTDEEGIAATGIVASTYRPRRVELVQAGRVIDSGKTRKTRKTASGRSATVWVAVV